MNEIHINNSIIGDGHPVYIIAELSANHCQNYDIAVKTIKAMKTSGADAIKVQTFSPDSMTLDSEKSWFKTREDSLWAGQKLYDLYKKAMLPWEWHEKLQTVAKDLDLDFFSSPFDTDSVDKLETLNVPAYKIASLEITDIPLIKKAASAKKPIIMSTGIATLEDIDLAVEACKSVNNDKIALLKCTSAYPSPYNEIHLNSIPFLKEKYNSTIGLSDHTLGISVPIAAVALGSKIIEKHFILDKSLNSVDKEFSLDPNEFSEMVQQIRNIEDALGSENYNLTEKMKSARTSARSLFAIKDIKKGETINKENIKSLRPGNGLHPKYYYEILGEKAVKDLERGDPLSLDHFK